MKLIALSGLFLICTVGADPLDIPKDNSHYVEGVSRYIWMPYGDHEVRLVDLEETGPEPMSNDTMARSGNDNQYWLFTRQNRNNRQDLIRNNANSVRNSNYRGNRGTVVIAHGWGGSGNSDLNVAIRNELLDAMDVNVIVLNWQRAARGSYSWQAAPNVPGVANALGDFITWLFQTAGGNWNNLHFVGHSLGAHLMGVAGRRVGRRVSRVTGLDPAGPHWGGNGRFAANRLRDNAARYVEAIHTDGRALGIMDRSAHADFYPNGGRHPQPGCRGGITQTECSHGRAHQLFVSTIRNSHRFAANRCADLEEASNRRCSGPTFNMGNSVFNKNGNGVFGLSTTANRPFF